MLKIKYKINIEKMNKEDKLELIMSIIVLIMSIVIAISAYVINNEFV